MTKAAILAALLIAGPALAETPLPLRVAPGDPVTLSLGAFRAEALRADAYSIALSRLALRRSKDARVRDYAERALTYRKATSKALDPDQAEALSPRDAQGSLGAAARARLDRLGAGSARSFDRAFIEEAARADARTLALYRGFAQSGDDETGRRFAAEAVPYLAAEADRSASIRREAAEAAAIPTVYVR